jgi:hypothetical protein
VPPASAKTVFAATHPAPTPATHATPRATSARALLFPASRTSTLAQALGWSARPAAVSAQGATRFLAPHSAAPPGKRVGVAA